MDQKSHDVQYVTKIEAIVRIFRGCLEAFSWAQLVLLGFRHGRELVYGV
jgi:hypothetical protein